MIEKRTENSIVEALPDGKKRVLITPNSPLHYKENYNDENEAWKDIDLTPVEVDGKLIVDKAPYSLQVFSGTRIIYRGNRLKETLEVSVQGASDVLPIVKDGGIYWENALQDTDINLVLSRTGVAFRAIIKTNKGPKTVVWDYVMDESVDPTNYVGDVYVVDAAMKSVKNAVRTDTKLTGGRKTFSLSVTFEDLVKTRNLETRIPYWGEGITYPVLIDPTVNENITTDSTDDGSENVGTAIWLANGTSGVNDDGIYNLYSGLYTGNSGLRFTTVDVANAATIDSAQITVEIISTSGSPNGARIYGDDVDSAAAFSSASLPSGITKTTAFTTLNSIATGSYAIDVKTIVQELVNRAGWAANNNMRFGLFGANITSGSGDWRFADTGHATGAPATLSITYTAAGGGSTPAPTPIPQNISGGPVIASGGMAL